MKVNANPLIGNIKNVVGIWYKKCNDIKKAERFFKERGIKYQFIDMKEKGMSKREIILVAQTNGEYYNNSTRILD